MKIYNEIVIDMNPESSSYGETLHEDSFEYNGEMVLMQGLEPGMITLSQGAKHLYKHKRHGGTITSNEYNHLRSEKALTNPASKGEGSESYEYYPQYPIYTQGVGGAWENTGQFTTTQSTSGHYPNLGAVPMGAFSYTESGEFDPTRSETQASILATGGYGELEKGFEALQAGDLGEFYDEPLKFMAKGFEIEKGKLDLQETSLAFITGKSLYDVKKQSDILASKTRGVYSSQVAEQEKISRGGIMQDYKLQQEELELGRQQAALGYKQDTEAFWESAYEQMYTDVSAIEELVDQ